MSAESRIAPRAKSEKMRKPDQNGRSFESASRSRSPRRRTRGRRNGSCARRGPRARSRRLRRRSAASWSRVRGRPPRRGATARSCATAFSACPEESRLAIPFGSAGNPGCRRPTRRGAHAAASARSRRRAPGAPSRYSTNCASQAPRASRAARADSVGEVLVDAVGHEELRVLGPPEEPLRRLHALGAERLAVRLWRVLDESSVADVAVHDDQRRPFVLGLEVVECAPDLGEVVRVRDRRHVPAIRGEPVGDVLRERESVCPSIVTRFES